MDDRRDRVRPATLCVQGATDEPTGAGTPLVTPVVRSSAFHLDDASYALRRAGRADETAIYSRETNPTVVALEERLAALEGAQRSLAFSSGMAALHALLMATLERGQRVLVARKLYGGSEVLARELLPRLGVELDVVDVDDLDGVRAALTPRTRVLLCESISNPLTAVADLPALAELARERCEACLLVVDATLASPVGQRPLALGADLVWHSATKYLGGHGDLLAGVLSGSAELVRRVWKWRTLAGGVLAPDTASLVERGLKTLAVRMQAHAANALRLARVLAEHPAVEGVHYCGLPGDPYHALAGRLLELPGGLFSFAVRGGDEAARGVQRRLRLFVEAASLGDVVSLVSRPADLSHMHLDADQRRAAGIAPGLLRLSVGIEDGDDLEADLLQALEGC